jgi:hydrogenase/urease accessory protein HupE
MNFPVKILRFHRAVLLVLLVPFVPCVLFAHDPGLSTATAKLSRDRLVATLGFSQVDAALIAQTPKEQLAEAATALQKLAANALEVRIAGQTVAATKTECRFDQNGNATISLNFPAPESSQLEIQSKWLCLLPTGHRQYFSLQNTAGAVLAEKLLSANADTVNVQLDAAAGVGQAGKPDLRAVTESSLSYPNGGGAVATSNSFADFLLMGVKHIWTGYDHLLFLFGLLIVSRNFASSLKIITCFTLAHSITLAVATLSLVQFSSRIVEPLIAASIVYVGIENLLRGDDPKGRWLLTFAFGLIHGFGFASVLRELGVGANGTGITVPLVSFNLGVELGQLAIAGLALPVIWKLRTQPLFIRRWVPACSALVLALGSFWFVQRVWF